MTIIIDELPEDNATLEQDADFLQALRRVVYEEGMMLGLEATRDEQEYHRRRITRHNYWLHGVGTLAGMAVTMDPKTSDTPAKSITVRLIVAPGIGIDGLGRELLVDEHYCLNLKEWLAAQDRDTLLEGYDGSTQLRLLATVRYKDCLSGLQPVMARKLNASTDAVQPSRTKDSVYIELIPEAVDGEIKNGYPQWYAHRDLPETLPAELTGEEQAEIDAAATPASRARMELQARMLYLFDEVDDLKVTDESSQAARIPLARITIQTADIDEIIVNPSRITINNMIRPFLVTPPQLAALAG